MDFYQYVLTYITDSDYKDWNVINCLKHLKDHLQFTSDSKQEILDAFTRAFKKVSESDIINSRTINKAKKLYNNVHETFQRREITEFFENLDQEFNERQTNREVYKSVDTAKVLIAKKATTRLEETLEIQEQKKNKKRKTLHTEESIKMAYTSEESDSDQFLPSEVSEVVSEVVQEHHFQKEFNSTIQEVIQNDLKDTSPSLVSIMQEYCKKNSTSKFDPAHSYILDLSSASKIAREFTSENWTKLVSDRPDIVNVKYHKELESIFDHLFGKQEKKSTIKNIQQARVQWENLRNIKAPEYKEEFSYDKDDWKKILWWIEWAVGRFLDAFEAERNPLLQQDCHEREWLGGYLVPIFQGALALDGRFRIAWGEITVQASLRRRNFNKIILEEKVDRGHLADLLCSTDSYEMLCLLACGGPHKIDLTKLASDEFHLPRMMKDILDDMKEKYNNVKKDKSCLYTIGIQQYKSEVRIYLMELRDIYRLHLIKTFYLPLTFTTFHNLRVSLSWAWNIRGLVNNLLEKLINDAEIDSITPEQNLNDMATPDTPSKTKKKKSIK